jgi:hypothetical protein
MTTAPGWAQELSHVAIEFIASLVPQSAGADLLGRGFQLKFNGAGSISLPTISQGQASFIGQAKAIPVAQFTTASGLAIVPHKLAMISVVTREMLESSNAEAIVGAVLIESAARGLDNALFSSGAGTADQPAGLLFGIAPTAASTSTILTDAMLVDLSTRGGAVARVAGSNIVYICAPEQAIAISVSAPNFACPVLASAALPPKTVVAVAAAAIASAYDPAPMIEASREAELVMDSAAGDLMTGGATSSLNHTDRIALRMKLPVAWALRSSSALAWIQSAVW